MLRLLTSIFISACLALPAVAAPAKKKEQAAKPAAAQAKKPSAKTVAEKKKAQRNKPADRAQRFEQSLAKLDPDERLEQMCDYAAMEKISKDNKSFKPDHAIIDTMSPPKADGVSLQGTGGAFRSGGRWYQFSFNCKLAPDHTKVVAFDYQVGEVIPEAKWESLGLFR